MRQEVPSKIQPWLTVPVSLGLPVHKPCEHVSHGAAGACRLIRLSSWLQRRSCFCLMVSPDFLSEIMVHVKLSITCLMSLRLMLGFGLWSAPHVSRSLWATHTADPFLCFSVRSFAVRHSEDSDRCGGGTSFYLCWIIIPSLTSTRLWVISSLYQKHLYRLYVFPLSDLKWPSDYFRATWTSPVGHREQTDDLIWCVWLIHWRWASGESVRGLEDLRIRDKLKLSNPVWGSLSGTISMFKV